MGRESKRVKTEDSVGRKAKKGRKGKDGGGDKVTNRAVGKEKEEGEEMVEETAVKTEDEETNDNQDDNDNTSDNGTDGVPAPTPTTDEPPVHPSRKHRTPNSKDTRTLFIRGLPYSTTTDSLTAHFSFLAPLKHAHVVIDPTTKQSRGFGFVTYTDEEDAKRAVAEFDGQLFEGRKLSVEFAEVRHREGGAGDAAVSGLRTVPKKAGINPPTEEEEQHRSPRLIIRNLPWNIKSAAELFPIFSRFGKVKDVIIPKSKKGNGLMAGFAFVTMTKHRHAEKAIQEVNGTNIGGRVVAVDWAVEKKVWEKVGEDGASTEPQVKKQDDSEEGDSDGSDVKSEADSDNDDDGANQHIDETSDISDSDDEPDSDFNDSDYDDEDTRSQRSNAKPPPAPNASLVLFIRNLPFSTTDDSLAAHFTEHFGPIRYARIVVDHETERPKGTGFVAFYEEEHFNKCLKNSPHPPPPGTRPSLLQNTLDDPTGAYTIDSRLLYLTRAVDRNEASRLASQSATIREQADKDKRRLYLLNEGTIPSNSPLYAKLSPSEIAIRADSQKSRKNLLASNPSLHLSLTRLSVRNIPRAITNKDLKKIARDAVVGFATEVRKGTRQPLSKEELSRGGDDEKDRERLRREKGKGIVTQVKIMYENGGAGRSKGFGFIEYVSHRWALMGLRWLNGREIGAYFVPETTTTTNTTSKTTGKPIGNPTPPAASKQKKPGPPPTTTLSPADRKKRLILEFALENASVIKRRKDHAQKSRDASSANPNLIAPTKAPRAIGGKPGTESKAPRSIVKSAEDAKSKKGKKGERGTQWLVGQKRKRLERGKVAKGGDAAAAAAAANDKPGDGDGRPNKRMRKGGPGGGDRKDGTGGPGGSDNKPEKITRKVQIIARKRAVRRARKGGK